MDTAVRSALTRYRVMAYIVGTMLLVLVLVAMPLKYVGDDESLIPVRRLPAGHAQPRDEEPVDLSPYRRRDVGRDRPVPVLLRRAPRHRSGDRAINVVNAGVGKGGVEPPRPFGHTDLNRARLPFRHLPC